MKITRRIQTFCEKHPLLGPVTWMVSVQYFVVQVVVASFWQNPAYSWSVNLISDLGATTCGEFAGRMVCSPLAGLMNASFIVLGVTMLAGSIIIAQSFRKTSWSFPGFFLMGLAGVATALVGVFPETVASGVHNFAAFLAFLVSELALLVFALALPMARWMKGYTLLSGVFSLLGLGLFAAELAFGFLPEIGVGTLERVASYPPVIWLIVFGLYISKDHFRKIRVSPAGELTFRGKAYRCAVGRGGAVPRGDKREGDGATPAGCFPLREVWYRADRVKRPETILPCRSIEENDSWEVDPKSEHYNRPKVEPDGVWGSLTRKDHLFDVMVFVGHNDDPPVAGKGSAIFLHLARDGYTPTAGCVALSERDLREVLSRLGPTTKICIEC